MRIPRVLCFVAVVIAAAACNASPASVRIAQEIERLDKTLTALESADLPKDVRDLIGVHRTALERAKRATSPEYRLYRLRDPFTGIETLSFVANEKSARESVDRFRELWTARRARFEAKAPKARGSLVQRALIESATTRAGRLFHASLPYAKAAEPWSGVYYLGEAEANLRFRDFVLSIAESSEEKSPDRARVTAMIESLEHTTLSFFAGDVTNQNLIPVSVRLKEARELLDANRVDGATLLAIEARAALSRRGGPRGSYPPDSASRTGSIVSLLRAWAADEEAPMSDALRDEVVPFYGAMYLTAPARAEKQAAQVTVTLVRWPYT